MRNIKDKLNEPRREKLIAEVQNTLHCYSETFDDMNYEQVVMMHKTLMKYLDKLGKKIIKRYRKEHGNGK